MAKKVVTFGEIMLRLAPEGYYRFVQAASYGATYGGGEANVAISLANYGMDASFVTKLPAHEIGQAGVNSLRQFGVDTSKIVRGGDRVGIYFLEKGASQRPSKVIYDRAGSAIATATIADFNWDEIFEGADWFHFTGITPALGDNVAEICLEACKAAKAKGITVSCDLNYRNKLWSKEKAGQVMGELCKYVDVCISNEEDANDVFGIKSEGTEVTAGELNKAGYQSRRICCLSETRYSVPYQFQMHRLRPRLLSQIPLLLSCCNRLENRSRYRLAACRSRIPPPVLRKKAECRPMRYDISSHHPGSSGFLPRSLSVPAGYDLLSVKFLLCS